MSLPADELKNRLKKALLLKNIKPVELSRMTNISKSAISQYTSGYAKPKQDRIHLICKALDISEAWLMGYDVPMEKNKNTPIKEQKDISSILANTEELLRQDGLMFDGEPASPESIDSILSAMKIGMEMAKHKSKEKYTPKKYKRE